MTGTRAPDAPTPERMQVTTPGHLFAELPFYDVVETDDTVIVDLRNRPELAKERGAPQGGLVATLIDVAGGRLAFAAGGRGVGVGTADMNIHYLAPVVSGPARAVATFVRKGSSSLSPSTSSTSVPTGSRRARR
jgi:uncharacterized protein (TIGR00369 family)